MHHSIFGSPAASSSSSQASSPPQQSAFTPFSISAASISSPSSALLRKQQQPPPKRRKTAAAAASASEGASPQDSIMIRDEDEEDNDEFLPSGAAGEEDTGIIMAVSHQAGRLGVACLERHTGELRWGETSQQQQDLGILEFIKFQINPSVILVPSSTDRAIVASLRSRRASSASAAAGQQQQDTNRSMMSDASPGSPASSSSTGGSYAASGAVEYDVQILKSTDFSYEAGKQRLFLLSKVLQQNAHDHGIGDDEGGLGGGFGALGDDGEAQDRLFESDFMFGLSTVDCVRENRQMVRAAGGLLKYLQDNRLQFGELDEAQVLRSAIRSVRSLRFDQCMQLDKNTLESLSIFRTERHPCQSRRIGVHKEGLSLFGIVAQHVRSGPGRDLLRSWFMQPLLDVSALDKRFDAVEFFSSSSQRGGRELLGRMQDALKSSNNTKRIVRRIREGKSTVNDWINLFKSISCFNQIVNMILEDEETLGGGDTGKVLLLRQLVELHERSVQSSSRSQSHQQHGHGYFGHGDAMEDDDVEEVSSGMGALLELAQLLQTSIDFRESKDKGRICIKPGIDDQLDQWKECYENMEATLTAVAAQVSAELPLSFPEISLVFFPQLGYHIAVPKNTSATSDHAAEAATTGRSKRGKAAAAPAPVASQSKKPFDLDREARAANLTLAFESNDTYYFKNGLMHTLDEEYGDIYSNIVDKENEIHMQNEQLLLARESMVYRMSDLLQELDCILAYAKCAIENNYVRPTVTKENVLQIDGGRHPLLEQSIGNNSSSSAGAGGGAFIANDTSVLGNSGRINIITGPNNSGKSVYLRQVGLIVFMAHVGCFVPARSARIGLTDRLQTRIQSSDSISLHQSTFAIDLIQMNGMVRDATERSLLLVDEFGKGTLALDGLSLLASTLRHFALRHRNSRVQQAQQGGSSQQLQQGNGGSPKVFVSTHYTELFEYGLLDDGVDDGDLVQKWSMQTVVDKVQDSASSAQDLDLSKGDQLIFLYKLTRQGRKGSMTSYAHAIAQFAGIPAELLRRAEQIQQKLSRGEAVEKLDETNDANGRRRREQSHKLLEKFAMIDLNANDKNEQVEQFRLFVKDFDLFGGGAGQQKEVIEEEK